LTLFKKKILPALTVIVKFWNFSFETLFLQAAAQIYECFVKYWTSEKLPEGTI
jgi:hypothetical protein